MDPARSAAFIAYQFRSEVVFGPRNLQRDQLRPGHLASHIGLTSQARGDHGHLLASPIDAVAALLGIRCTLAAAEQGACQELRRVVGLLRTRSRGADPRRASRSRRAHLRADACSAPTARGPTPYASSGHNPGLAPTAAITSVRHRGLVGLAGAQ